MEFFKEIDTHTHNPTIHIFCGYIIPPIDNTVLRKKSKLQASHFLISNFITKL